MEERERLRTGRDLAVEGLVVILSILIAFSLDAWWDGRREASELRLTLANVLSEIQETRGAVESRIAEYEAIVRASTALLEVMDGHPTDPYVVVPDTIAYLASKLPSLNPRLSALDALVASGLLASVPDRELRSALGRLRGEMEDAIAEIERMRAVFFSVQTPELSIDFDTAPIIRLVEAGQQPGVRLPSSGSIRYPNRLTVRNHTRERRVVVRWTIIDFEQLDQTLATIEARIAVELGA